MRSINSAMASPLFVCVVDLVNLLVHSSVVEDGEVLDDLSTIMKPTNLEAFFLSTNLIPTCYDD